MQQLNSVYVLITFLIYSTVNTRNFLSKGTYNKSINKRTKIEIFHYIEESIKKKKSPKCGQRSILNSQRKTGFLGLIICLTSLKSLVLELIDTEYLSFILTYKFSQVTI